MERLPLDRALARYEAESPHLAARATAALERLLSGITASKWPEVAWRFSRLTADGYPVELSFASTGESIRYTLEAAGPECDPAARLDRALAQIKGLSGEAQAMAPITGLPGEARGLAPITGLSGEARVGASPLSRSAAMERLRSIQSEGRLDYGAWVGVRHGPKDDAFKLYAEIPKGGSLAADDWMRELLGERPLLPNRSPVLRMVGIDTAAEVIELYYRADHLQPWEIRRMTGVIGMAEQADELLGLVEDLTERSAARQLPFTQTGFSVSIGLNGGTPGAFSLFCPAGHVLGGDNRIRQRLLDFAQLRDYPFRHYAALSAPLTDREGPPTRHGMLSFVAAPGVKPLLHIGLRPP